MVRYIAAPVAPHPALRATFSPLCGEKKIRKFPRSRGEEKNASTRFAGRRKQKSLSEDVLAVILTALRGGGDATR